MMDPVVNNSFETDDVIDSFITGILLVWKEVLELLTSSNKIESISVYVNNDTAEKIATNLADRVPLPWYQGYQGNNTTTLIYHK